MSVGENIIWVGRPSQLTNFKYFLLCLLIVPIPYAIWKWLEVRCIQYELTTQRLRFSQGVFTRKTDEIELYRIKDTALVEPFWERMFSLGNVVLITSDRSTPELILVAIAHAAEVREKIRAQVEVVRTSKGVREVDFETGDQH
jgi:uncharacterized membrane protein YdbT with pleckstrin-like domain